MLESGNVRRARKSHTFDELPLLGAIFRISFHALEHRHEPFLRWQVLNRALASHRVCAQRFQQQRRKIRAGASDCFEG